ncbi:hypothetical protein [Ruegeria sp. HKCCD8929]|uniref:hypothetical protein n=1 Tax=Ruegeria sp. HKCCD8929 TaxID=2683006 RepID=UPI001487CCF1|nr:hypothetical protein [Ruegeria sp. HKCCD8929]
MRRWVKAHGAEIQFWGYEGGNIVAAIAGAGGFAAFNEQVFGVWTNVETGLARELATSLFTYPDAAIAIGLGIVVLLTSALSVIVRRFGAEHLTVWIDAVAFAVAVGLLAVTIWSDATWLTLSATAFVAGSALLRLCQRNPLVLKPGGILLSTGGIGLIGYGTSAFDPGSWALQSVLTVLTGFFVASAGLLTYQGGIAACRSFDPSHRTPHFLHPRRGLVARWLSRFIDRPVLTLVQHLVLPTVFWVDCHTKAQKPFATSMWARLPWRAFAGLAALATGTPEGIVFAVANAGWALGDIAIGSLDWEDHQPEHLSATQQLR